MRTNKIEEVEPQLPPPEPPGTACVAKAGRRESCRKPATKGEKTDGKSAEKSEKSEKPGSKSQRRQVQRNEGANGAPDVFRVPDSCSAGGSHPRPRDPLLTAAGPTPQDSRPAAPSSSRR